MIEFYFRKYFLGFLVWAFFKILSKTWKVVVDETPEMKKAMANKDPMILAHWHGDEAALVCLISRYKLATITSTSKDGEMITTVVHLLGGATSRGSSTRGGVSALKGLIRIVKKEKRHTSFSVDGPRGPIYQVKPGVFEFSRLTGAPIFCVGVACDRKWTFHKAWNKAYLPKPFAKIYLQWVGPFGPVTSDQNARSPELAGLVKDALQNAQTIALKKIDAAAPFG